MVLSAWAMPSVIRKTTGEQSQFCMRLVKKKGSWKVAANQRQLEPGSRGIAIVRSRCQATTSEGTANWISGFL
jgi:hypothetical protein